MTETSTGSILEKRRSEDFSAELKKTGWYHSFEFPDGRTIQGFLPIWELKERWAEFPLPANLEGRRILDIGTWDGWFAFEAERRGADVVAIDNVEQENFREVHCSLHSKVDYRIAEVYELGDLGVGRFDYTFFLGVLYHLRHPLRALELVCAATRELAIVDSFIVDDSSRGALDSPIPWLEFYETTELSNQLDNWFGPTLGCLVALCRSAGFARVELLNIKHRHARLACYRHWEPLPAVLRSEAPVLRAVVNGRFGDNGINFSTRKEEFLSCWFRLPQDSLKREDLRLEVAGLGTPALALHRTDAAEWNASFILPPGLEAGWQNVRLRTTDSEFSGVCRIAVDLRVQSHDVTIRAISDSVAWTPNEVTFSSSAESAYATLWIDGLGANCDRNNVRVYTGTTRLQVEFVSGIGEEGTKQVNACMPRRVGSGKRAIRVEAGGVPSAAMTIEVKFVS